MSTVLLASLHWFTVTSILIQPVCADLMLTENENLFPHPGLWIWDNINGDGGTEEKQSMPGCSIACTWPPGGNDRHAAECCGAGCPGHRQGNTTINTAAATISVKALGSSVIKPPPHNTGEWKISCVHLRARKILRGGELLSWIRIWHVWLVDVQVQWYLIILQKHMARKRVELSVFYRSTALSVRGAVKDTIRFYYIVFFSVQFYSTRGGRSTQILHLSKSSNTIV